MSESQAPLELGIAIDRRADVPIGVQLAWALRTRIGDGRFVGPTPRRPSAVGAIAANAAREAHATGVDPREVAAALYVSPESPPHSDDEALKRRRLLRIQISALERALGEIEAEHPGVAPGVEQTRLGIGPALLDAEALERVRTLLVRRLSTVQAAIDAHLGRLAAAEEDEAQASAAVRERRPAKPRPSADAPATPVAPKRTAHPRASTRPAPAGT
jgi:hypothetical protein